MNHWTALVLVVLLAAVVMVVETCSQKEVDEAKIQASHVFIPPDAYKDCYIKGGKPKLASTSEATTFECDISQQQTEESKK
jgi:hypothetical protein